MSLISHSFLGRNEQPTAILSFNQWCRSDFLSLVRVFSVHPYLCPPFIGLNIYQETGPCKNVLYPEKMMVNHTEKFNHLHQHNNTQAHKTFSSPKSGLTSLCENLTSCYTYKCKSQVGKNRLKFPLQCRALCIFFSLIMEGVFLNFHLFMYLFLKPVLSTGS